MSKSTNLNLPYLLPAQAQKHVTHNEALKMLDVLVQLSVVDNTLSAPPQTPSEGDSYTIASSPTGDWAGKEDKVTIWHDGAWSFYPPNKGWITWVENNNSLQAYNGSHWVDISGVLSASTASKLGINATADMTNRLSINSGAILFNKEVDDVQVKLNKQASTDNASFLFQTNWSGRAEIGTSGDDDFHFKVSSDGATWKEGILIDASTGEVSFPNTTLNISGSADLIDELVTRVFARKSPAQWGFCHVVSEAYTDLAKTTKAISVDDVVVVIEDKSPNDIDLVAGGTNASTKIKLRLDPATVGVAESHLTTHFLKVTIPTGGFKGTLIMAYRGGCLVQRDLDVPAGDLNIWSGDSMAVESGFIGAFAAESISNADIDKILEAFYNLGADSKPLSTASSWCVNASNLGKTIDLSNFDFSTCTDMYQLMRDNTAEKVILPGDDLSSVTTMYSAFRNCTNLTTLDASNWDLSSVTTMFLAFYQCTNLTALDTSGWDLSSVTTMYAMFNGCAKFTTLNTSGWDLSSVTNLRETFNACTNLTTLDTCGWDLSSVTTMYAMFRDCIKLTTLDASNWDLSSLATAEDLCRGCTKLTKIIIGDAFDSTPCTNFTDAFINCAFDQQSVDDILVSIENAGTSNGTLNMTGTNNSAPSSTGNTAKTALVGRGWTVTTN